MSTLFHRQRLDLSVLCGYQSARKAGRRLAEITSGRVSGGASKILGAQKACAGTGTGLVEEWWPLFLPRETG